MNRSFLPLSVIVAATLLALIPATVVAADTRPFTEVDAIEMTAIADPDYWHHNQSLDRVAHYSPDGTKVVVALRKGNLAEGTTDYSLVLYRAEELFRKPSPRPQEILRMSSSSNREIFEALKWLPDNQTLLFLGERPGETRQVFSFDLATRELEQRTDSSTGVRNYSTSADGQRILYLAEQPADPIWNSNTRQHGLVVSDEHLGDLLAGTTEPKYDRGNLYLLLEESDKSKPRKLDFPEALQAGFTPALSPDGKYALVRVFAPHVPEHWRAYTDPMLQSAFPQKPLKSGETSHITEWVIVDVETGEVRSRLDAPQISTDGGVDAEWAPDSASVIVTLVYLPVNGVAEPERQKRIAGPFTAELDLNGNAWPLAPESLLAMSRIEHWDRDSNTVALARQTAGSMQRTFLRKQGEAWSSLEAEAPKDWPTLADLSLREGLNMPPRIFVIDPVTGSEQMLLDLNPHFANVTFGRQEEIEWKATDGTVVRGGLYYPTDFVKGKRYPLVIQTHGYLPDVFGANGVFVAPYAAQSLANHGFVVLQAWDYPAENNEQLWQEYLVAKIGKPAMHQFEQAVYEGAVDHLDSAGFIDRNKVGLIGFSFTAWSVKYALAHPNKGYHFAAASVSDGFDGGYFDYIAHGNTPGMAQQFEVNAGGQPWGDGMQAWLKEAPAFQIDKVSTPIRMIPLKSKSLLSDWEWHVLLKRMERPAELVFIEDGTHTLVKPWDRMVSSGGNVDWFRFWLKGEEDPAQEKQAQYVHWRELRMQQCAHPDFPGDYCDTSGAKGSE